MNTTLHAPARRPALAIWPRAKRRERDDTPGVQQRRRTARVSSGMGVSTLALGATIAVIAAWAADVLDLTALAAGADGLVSMVAAFIGQAPF